MTRGSIGRSAAFSSFALATLLATPGAASAQPVEQPPLAVPQAAQLPGRYSDLGPRSTGQPVERFVPTIGIEETATTNANFDRGIPERQGDFVTVITPGFLVDLTGAHSRLFGSLAVPIYLYVKTSRDNNRAIPDAHLLGTLDGLDRHLFLDAGFDAHREFVSPLGARPSGAAVNTDNEYLSTVYRLTPALRGDLPNLLHYDVTDSNVWTNASRAPDSILNTYTNDAHASLTREPAPLGWTAEYQKTRVNFSSRQTTTIDIARIRASDMVDPELIVSVSGGYEKDDFVLVRQDDTIYGVGVQWHPSDRTSLDATWEHRFFGSSYLVSFDHRTPLSVWSVRGSRDISLSPQQVSTLGAGFSVATILNSLLQSQYPDPVARQQAIDSLFSLYGLPSTLSGPVNLYTQQVSLVTDFRATAGFLGARNNVYISGYRRRDEAIVSAFGTGNFAFHDVNQTGANLTWSSRVQPLMTLTGILDYSHSTGESLGALQTERTTNGLASLTLSTPVSPLTDFHVGVRYQYVTSNALEFRQEYAVYTGIMHRFR